jgi:hypothetical protein
MARLFTVASDDTLLSMISSARERLVIVAPGLSKEVASALADRIATDGWPQELSVTLDVDPEVCRLGYGDLEALEILGPALALRDRPLQTQKGVRVGLVVADSDVLVYSPTPQLIEAGSNSEEKPNAIRISGVSSQGLAFACGASDTSVLGLVQEVGLNTASENAIEKTKADLKENPPRLFNLVRLERVFNYKLEFVEFSLEGFRLSTRIVPLPPELLGLVEEDLQERLRNTFRVFEAGVPFELEITDPHDAKKTLKVTEKWLSAEANKIRDDFFIPLGSSSYGNLILKRRKHDFERRVYRLRSLVDGYAEKVKETIAAKIKITRENLIHTLLPRVTAAPPPDWLAQSVDGSLEPNEVSERLASEVDKAFGKVEETFFPIVTCIFKGVQYETITADPHFRERIEKHFGKRDAAKLLSEYDASRAEDLFEK